MLSLMSKQTTGTAPVADAGAVPSAAGDPSVGGQETVADPVKVLLAELAAYARSHYQLRNGRGNTDDVLGFIDWWNAQ